MLPNDFYETNLSRAWKQINCHLFGGALLVPPTIMLVAMEHHAADWNAAKSLIRFSRTFVESHPWITLVEVLKHEMAHQYVSHVLGIDDETPHGPAFQMVCERYAIDGRASGLARTEREEHAIDKIKKLFRLGESPNENESKAALRKAHKLLDDYGLAESDLGSRETDGYGVCHVGDVVYAKRPEDYRMVVSNILSRYFRVRNIWMQTFDYKGCPGLQLEVCGRRCDLAIAEHVHGFLHDEALRLWSATKGTRRRDRLDFLEGVMRGFLESLVEEEKARTAFASGATLGLVPTAMKARLDDYFERRNPSTRSIRGGRRHRGAMYGDGVEAGRNISLRSPLDGGGPRLLGKG